MFPRCVSACDYCLLPDSYVAVCSVVYDAIGIIATILVVISLFECDAPLVPCRPAVS
jgi:hypothetical protein